MDIQIYIKIPREVWKIKISGPPTIWVGWVDFQIWRSGH